jgi:TfoX/Sxy family transcriptional regulator of competence genes
VIFVDAAGHQRLSQLASFEGVGLMAYDEKTAERVRKVLSGRADVAEKKLMGGLCFMVKGGMCCSVSGKGGLLVRIGPEAQARMLREPHVRPMQVGRRTMTGFVRVDPEGYRTDRSLRTWVMRGVDYLATRPEKAARGRGKRTRPHTSAAKAKS